MTTHLATRTAGYIWPGEDLSTELFLRNGTGSAWAATTREPLPEVPAPGIWHTLMTFAKYGKPDLDALRQCVVEVLNDTGPGSIQVLLDLLCVPTNSELSVQIGSMSGASQTQVSTSGSGSVQLELRGETAAEEPSHARLAREIREMTDLPAASLAAALGVTREQYQRWLKGSPISNTRHGQLIFLHTIAADLSRRVGADRARVWWRTPVDQVITPEQLLQRRRLDKVHRLIIAVPDPQPIVDGVLQVLPHQQDVEYADDIEDEDDADSWSPYGDATSKP